MAYMKIVTKNGFIHYGTKGTPAGWGNQILSEQISNNDFGFFTSSNGNLMIISIDDISSIEVSENPFPQI